jgi:NACalpha-BTF3-like transcription factor
MVNHFEGFRRYHEKEEKEKPDQYVSTVKKQLGIGKKLWMGMPVVLSNVKIGKSMIRDPRVFYVTDFDDATVTIKNVKNPMSQEEEDMDDEINLDKDDWDQKQFVLPRNDFYKLLEPEAQGDFATASQSMGGAPGGM